MSAYAFGNNRAGYRGETMAEMIESIELGNQQKYHKLIRALVELIGKANVDAWCDQIEIDRMTTPEAIREIEHKLDQFECYCTPFLDPCGGCQRLAELRRQ